MKKIQYAILTLCILLSLTGCTRNSSSETKMTSNEIAVAIIESQSAFPEMNQISSADESFSSWLSDYYKLSAEQVEDGTIYYANGAEVSEVAVLILQDKTDAETVETALTEYITNRAEVFEGYAPQLAMLAKNGIVVVNDKYVALLICEDTSAAKTAFLSCFEKNQNVTDNVYDSAAILQAWKSGDDSSLSEINRSILDAAKHVINSEISENMSNYEKELAIHDWIIKWSRFDMNAFSHSPGSNDRAESDNPYGVLVCQTGNCWGYSSTFQLFMDMLEIECITVYGIPNSSGVEHAWNMVQLDDEWYCVDTAWDDPIGGNPNHTYFNVTSEYLRNGSIHRWNDTSVPEATGTKFSYDNN